VSWCVKPKCSGRIMVFVMTVIKDMTTVSDQAVAGMGSSFDDFMRDYKTAMTPDEQALYQTFAREYDLASQMIGLRKAKGLSQQELAARAHVHQSEISRIERGVANPHKSTLDAIAKAMGAKLRLVPARADHTTGLSGGH